VVYEGATLSYAQIPNATLFRRVFLVVPAALLGALSCIGYLRCCQREVYDFLAISRWRILGKTGLHELRLPSDYILGLSLLHTQGGALGKILSSILTFLAMAILTLAPAFYVIRAAVENITVYGISDFLAVAASCTAITLSVSSLMVIGMGIRIMVTKNQRPIQAKDPVPIPPPPDQPKERMSNGSSDQRHDDSTAAR